MVRLAGLAVIVLIVAGMAWFLTDVAPEKAVRFDSDVQTALQDNDLAKAYRRAQFAVALRPSDERRITAGALAYLNEDYGSARSFFSALKRHPDSDQRRQAQVGAAAAAAADGDDETYEELIKEIGTPEAEAMRIGLASGALESSRMDAARDLVKEAPRTKEAAYITAILQLVDDPKAAQEAVAADGELRIESGNQAFDAFLREISRPGDVEGLKKLVAKAATTSSKSSRRVLLADYLYTQQHYRTAAALADAAVREEPLYRDAWNVLAASQLAQEDYDGAKRSLATSLKLDDAFGYTWYLQAELAKAQGDSKEAEFRAKAKTFGYEPG